MRRRSEEPRPFPEPRVLRPETFREKGVNVFVCPICGKEFRQADEFEPICSGPGALDTHPYEVMVFSRVEAPRRLILP